MRIAACDDNSDYLDFLVGQITKYTDGCHYTNVSVDSFLPDELLELLENGKFNYNIILLDIIMGSYDGIDIARKINKAAPACSIIFISNYLDMAIEVYDVSHIYFILKSELEKRLPSALEKAALHFTNENGKYINIISNSRNICLNSKDIAYAEIYGKKLTIHLTDGESYISNLALKKLHEQLPDFIRIHNSYLINPLYIRSISKDSCSLSNGIALRVSRTYSKKAAEDYNRYLASIL